jgi:hypothetical protein
MRPSLNVAIRGSEGFGNWLRGHDSNVRSPAYEAGEIGRFSTTHKLGILPFTT